MLLSYRSLLRGLGSLRTIVNDVAYMSFNLVCDGLGRVASRVLGLFLRPVLPVLRWSAFISEYRPGLKTVLFVYGIPCQGSTANFGDFYS